MGTVGTGQVIRDHECQVKILFGMQVNSSHNSPNMNVHLLKLLLDKD